MSSSKPAILPTPSASCPCSIGTLPAPARRHGRPPLMVPTPAAPISSPPRTAASPMSPSTRSAASPLLTWSKAFGSTVVCAISAPASRLRSPASSAPTAPPAARGAGSNTSGPTSGPPWWPTIWCCSPASNWLSRPARPQTAATSQIRLTWTARNASPVSIAATNTRDEYEISALPLKPPRRSLATPLKNASLWMRTSYYLIFTALLSLIALVAIQWRGRLVTRAISAPWTAWSVLSRPPAVASLSGPPRSYRAELGHRQQGERAQRFQRVHDLGDQGQGPLSAQRAAPAHGISRAQARGLRAVPSLRGECGADRGQGLRHAAGPGADRRRSPCRHPLPAAGRQDHAHARADRDDRERLCLPAE